MADVDVVIVNYKSADHTARCVAAVHAVAAADGFDAQAIVVNNADAPALLDAAVAASGGALVLHNAANAGFGAACNQGAARGTAPYILILNPDATLEPGALRRCRDFLADPANAAFGIVGPEIVDSTGIVVPSCSALPTPLDLLVRTAGLHLILPTYGYPYLSAADHALSRPVGQVMGAALMIRRDLFAALQGFDDAFFLYYEDVDLCARAQSKGQGSYYLKEARVRHVGAGSSSQASGMALALHIASRGIYARRHFGRVWQAAILLAAVAIELPARLVRCLAKGRDIGMVLEAYRLLMQSAASGTTIAALHARAR